MNPSMTTREHLGWVVHERGPSDADHAILLIPGGFVGSGFFDDIARELVERDPRLRVVQTTIPGYAGTKPLDDISQDAYAASASQLAHDLGCDVVVGHSMGANVAVDMASSGGFSGPVILLSPSFSRKDEAAMLWFFDRLGMVPGLGRLVWRAVTKITPIGLKSTIPPARRESLLAEMRGNDPRFFAAHVHGYFQHLNEHGSLVGGFCRSGVRAWVAFGGRKDVNVRDDERRELEAANVTMVDWPDAGHMTVFATDAVVDLILQARADLD